MALVLAGGNRNAADSTDDRGVGELRAGRDDGVGDIMIDGLVPSVSQYHPPHPN